jgi:hypothetical protein
MIFTSYFRMISKEAAVLIMNKTQVIRIGGTRSANAEGQGVLAF